MSLARLRRRHGDFYAPRFEIALDETTLTEASGAVSDLTVDTILDGADRFSCTVTDAFDLQRGFGDPRRARFRPGTGVEISIGYRTLVPTFVGRVQTVQPSFPAGGSPTLGVSGYGLLYDMMGGKVRKTWQGSSDKELITDSDVASEIASERSYQFATTNVDPTGVDLRRIVQEEQTDYEFLKARAERYNFELFARGETFHFRAPRDTEKSAPNLTLKYGESLSSFSIDAGQTNRVGTVVVTHTDPKTKGTITGSATRPDLGSERKSLNVPVESKQEAERVARAELSRIAQSQVQGSGETIGLPEIRVGETIGLEGLGAEFNGIYYVTSASHRIGGSGYTTSFQVRRPERWVMK